MEYYHNLILMIITLKTLSCYLFWWYCNLLSFTYCHYCVFMPLFMFFFFNMFVNCTVIHFFAILKVFRDMKKNEQLTRWRTLGGFDGSRLFLVSIGSTRVQKNEERRMKKLSEGILLLERHQFTIFDCILLSDFAIISRSSGNW